MNPQPPSSIDELRNLIWAHPLVPILRADRGDRLVATSEALAALGVRVIELTATTPGSYEALARLRSMLPVATKVGMGTILSADDANRARDAGADYLVMPAVLPHVAAATELPAVIGAWTPTEVLAAWALAPALVKMFPAGASGLAHLRALREIYPEIPLLPTGGITADTAGDYVRAGAFGVGLGGSLLRPVLGGPESARQANLDQLATTVKHLLEQLSAARPDLDPR